MPPTHDDRRDVDSGPIWYRRLSCIFDETEDEAIREEIELCLLTAEEPRDITEALSDGAWKAAMDAEMDSIRENNTWELAHLPAGHKAIGFKWVYRVKRDPDGNIVKYKAHLVA